MGGPKNNRKVESESGNEVSGDSKVISTLKQMFDEFKSSIQLEISALQQSVQFMSNKFDAFSEELCKTKEDLKTTQGQVHDLKKENELLWKQINELQQYTRRDNLLVFGIPETPEESVPMIVQNISEVIGGPELVADLSVVHRLPAKPGKTKPIVVRFNKRISRDTWLQKFKLEARKHPEGPGIPLQRINPLLPDGRLTAGEHLTIATRDLLNKTREAANQKGYRFVWTRDCKVFIRKDETSPAYKINSFQDLITL